MFQNIFSNMDGLEKQCNHTSCVILGDSLSVLKKIKSNSIDLIFADPPYGLGKDFGITKDTYSNIDDYLLWSRKWIDECMRVLKHGGTMYFMSSTQFMPALDRYVDENYYVINRIVWVYDSSGVQSKAKFGSLYEPILMITHNENVNYTFNYKDVMIEAKTGAKRNLIDYRKSPPQPYSTTKVPGNVWKFNRVRYKMKEYENHPSQKPESLLERIILVSSNTGEIVLDPFSGSFTTSAVANRLGRKAIGIDINPDYYKIGLRRSGLAIEYNGEVLYQDKSRKTKNKSKQDHYKHSSQTALSFAVEGVSN
ncbi:MAG: adenine-specific DNA-methyltransferase [Holophagaceae bacterium]|nr:adenine-specific DNA-methyltransferase [Holophagaceae bacterium]